MQRRALFVHQPTNKEFSPLNFDHGQSHCIAGALDRDISGVVRVGIATGYVWLFRRRS